MAKLTSESIQNLLEQGETSIRSGHGHVFRQQLENLNTAQVPNNYRLPLANLCRRAGLVTVALRILAPRISLQKLGTSADTTDGEMAEYALLLQRIGSLAEAHRLLDMVDTDKEPKALLYRAFCHFNQWEHQQSIPYLEKYVENIEDNYQQLIGKLNLAAAFCISNKFEKSLGVIEDCLSRSKATEKWRLYANSLELKAQNLIHQNQSEDAEALIQEASIILQSNKTYDALFIKKWEAYLAAQKQQSVGPLKAFKMEAIRQQAWESAREADLYSLLVGPDQMAFDHLYFGTPFTEYRKRIELLTHSTPSCDMYFLGPPDQTLLDVESGSLDGEVIFPLGKKVHQTIELFTRDLYRPCRLGDMFSILYPGEHFDINSSPERIYQIVKRTRQFVREVNLPIEIEEAQGYYQMKITGPLTLKLNQQRTSVDGLNPYLTRLQNLFVGGSTFCTQDVKKCLNLKQSKARDVLELGIQNGLIIKSGQSSATKYQFITGKASD